MFNKVPLAEASTDQLKVFATLTLQIEAAFDTDDRNTLLGLIESAGWPNDYVLAEAQAPQSIEHVESVRPTVNQVFNDYDDDPKVVLEIQETELPGGKDPVPVAVNGKTLVIQRRQRASVPLRFFYVLRDSMHGTIVQDEKTREVSETNTPRFPTIIHEMPSRDEQLAWMERTAAAQSGDVAPVQVAA